MPSISRIFKDRITQSGLLFSIFIIFIGYALYSNVTKEVYPASTFVVLALYIFLGLYSGYYLGYAMKESKKIPYFFVGLLTPILILTLFISFFYPPDSQSFIYSIIMLTGLASVVSIINTDLITEHNKFKQFIDVLAKYLGEIALVGYSIGWGVFPFVKVVLNFDIPGIWGFVIILILLSYQKQNKINITIRED
jgi:uncharacterized membrane protein (Fun14 family)